MDMDKMREIKAGGMTEIPPRSMGGDDAEPAEDGMAIIARIESDLEKLKRLYGGGEAGT